MEPPTSEATQAVQVALNIRPLITSERIQGCKDCIYVVPGEPQVQIGSHSFTFDHVFGSAGTPLPALFGECVAPLVEGLFHGYNATVLAYGQTGSGKTFTMGTGYTVGGSIDGVIPQVMSMLFSTMETLKEKAEFLLRVSFIEILKEEIHDLLDPSPPVTAKPDLANGGGMFGGVAKLLGPAKPPIQIRETTNGGITIAGITETVVNNISEMACCLEQGSLCRATGSTNMNSSSSRSHAIFTVILEQRKKWETPAAVSSPQSDDLHDDFLCAKLHLVDLAGSERVKRTGADGLRFKEGVHINRGLLALGNVISALGDEKKRKEGGHVPYRDSKLTRLLQDSLGGNSRTVMIACVSPADSNAEETLNTLKYANRARNIQNKPTVNRDPIAAEIQRMRQRMDLMQAELQCARAGGGSSEDIQMLKERITWLEASNTELQRDLQASNGSCSLLNQRVLDAQVERDILQMKLLKAQTGNPLTEAPEEIEGVDLLKKYLKRIQELEDNLEQAQSAALQPGCSAGAVNPCLNEAPDTFMALNAGFQEEVACTSTTDEELNVPAGVGEAYDEAKELEHTLLQDKLDRELQELNKDLEQKEAEMKSFTRSDGSVVRNHFEKKLVELEDEKKMLQKERDGLLNELETLTSNTDESAQKMQETYQQKLKLLETQISELKKKHENHSQLLRQKQRSEEAAKRLQEEIHRIKTQKVQLQQKIKQEAEQFRHWKASREKELLQLRKEGRKTEYEMHKLQALNQRQKMVLQRKTEEAALATRRLKELLEARKPSPRDNLSQGGAVANNFMSQNDEKGLQQWLEQELEVTVRVHEVRSAYEKQAESRVSFAKELRKLQEEEEHAYQQSPIPTAKRREDNDSSCPGPSLTHPSMQPPLMSPNARRARMGVLESLVNTSSTALVSMASQLSEAEERERMYSGRARWQHIRTLGDAKNLLQLIFNAAAFSRCQVRDKDEEIRELKERIAEMEDLLRKSARRIEIDRRNRLKEKTGTTTKVFSELGVNPLLEEPSTLPRSFNVKDGLTKNFGDFANSENCIYPYALRKASRGLQSSKIAPLFESDGLEGESDMDISDGGVSDEDWEDRSTRYTVKKSRESSDRTRIRKEGRLSQVNRISRVGSKPVQDQEASQSQVSGCRVRPPAGEIAYDDCESQSRPGTEGCCSCSPCSGCKTRKCECKAAGGLCGPNCGCKASKCANRESVEVEADPSAVATAVQMEMAEAVATLRVAKEWRRVNDEGDSVERGSSKHAGQWLAESSTRRAQQVLAFHGATVLDSAWRESRQEEQLQSAPETSDGCGGDIPVRRKPLGDIGNKKVKPQGRTLFKPRRRANRGSVHSELPNRLDFASETATAIATSALSAATSPSAPAAGNTGATEGRLCVDGEETRKDAPIKGASVPTTSRPLAACENLLPTGSPNFIERDDGPVKSSSSTSSRSSTDVDKENRFLERKGHS